MNFRLPRVPALLALGFALMQIPSAVQAQQGPPPASRLTPQQQQKLFPEQRQLWLQHARARIDALQSGERCVQAARTADAFKSCIRQERQTNMSLRRSHWSEMRDLYSRYGIQLPERPDRRGDQGGWKRPGGVES